MVSSTVFFVFFVHGCTHADGKRKLEPNTWRFSLMLTLSGPPANDNPLTERSSAHCVIVGIIKIFDGHCVTLCCCDGPITRRSFKVRSEQASKQAGKRVNERSRQRGVIKAIRQRSFALSSNAFRSTTKSSIWWISTHKVVVAASCDESFPF